MRIANFVGPYSFAARWGRATDSLLDGWLTVPSITDEPPEESLGSMAADPCTRDATRFPQGRRRERTPLHLLYRPPVRFLYFWR